MRHTMRSWRQMLAFLLLSVIWGSTWAAIRVSVEHLPTLRSVSLRFLLASLVLIPVMLVRRVNRPTQSQWFRLVIGSIVMVIIPFSLIAWASRRVSSGMISVLFAITPLLTAAIESRRGKVRSRITRPVIIGLVGGLVGILLVLLGANSISRLEEEGAIVVLVVVVLGAISSIVAKDALGDISPLTITAITSLVAGVLLGGASLLMEQGQKSDWTPSAVLAMLFLGLASTAVGSLLFFWLLSKVQPYQLATRYFLMPIIAIIEGTFLLGEQVLWSMIVGTAFVLGSMVLVIGVKPKLEPAASLSND